MTDELIENRVRAFLRKNQKGWGSRLVLTLQYMPDEPVHVIKLSQLIEPPEYSQYTMEQTDRMIEEMTTIPQTDQVTLRQVNAEINRLIKVKAWRQQAGLPCDTEDFQLEMLCHYHRSATRPDGSIKNFRLEEEREYQRHQKAVKRLLMKAKRECPEAYDYIRAHLKMGIFFTWFTDGVN